MGIFGSINNKFFGAIYGRKLAAMQRGIARHQLDTAELAVDRAQQFREKEDPREQAQLNQGMWARGLGKSSINDQNRERLLSIQSNRNEQLARAMELVHKKRRYLNKSAQINRGKFWSDIGAEILDTALMAMTGMGGGPASGVPGTDEGGEGSMMGGMGGGMGGGGMGF